jgi:NADPH:quinone reductase-like Zn-dependent oxidoreductase
MKAIRIRQYGGSNTLQLEEVPHLSISEDQILVRIHDAGVNPVDWKIREGYLKEVRPARFPLTIGQDFAGEVAEVGKAIEQFAIGDRVFGFAEGSYADYATASPSGVSRMPDGIPFVTAAALPTAGSTALQIVRDAVGARPGMSVLIHGAAGGVGSFASQLAKNMGARVIGTATNEDIQYLQSIGIDEVIDYRRERFEDRGLKVDAVVDLVGGETLTRSYSVVKSGGLLATTVQPVDESAATRAGIRAILIVMKRNATDLAQLAAWVEKGVLRPRLAQTVSLEEAKTAQELMQSGKTHGKVILKVA